MNFSLLIVESSREFNVPAIVHKELGPSTVHTSVKQPVEFIVLNQSGMKQFNLCSLFPFWNDTILFIFSFCCLISCKPKIGKFKD